MTSLLRELVPLPMPGPASRTIVSRPRSANSRATARPTAPAPATTASIRSTNAASALRQGSISDSKVRQQRVPPFLHVLAQTADRAAPGNS